jgi:vancomycin resistance protein YoaR
MTKVPTNNKHKKIRATHIGALTISVASASLALFIIVTAGRVYPQIYVEQIPVGGLSLKDAQTAIENATFADSYQAIQITVRSGDEVKDFMIPLSEIDAVYDSKETAVAAYEYGKDQGLVHQINVGLALLRERKTIPFVVSFNETLLKEKISQIAEQVGETHTIPKLTIVGNEVTVIDGTKGIEINQEELTSQIETAIKKHTFTPITIETAVVDPTLDPISKKAFEEKGKALVGKTLTITFDNGKIKRSAQDLATIISPEGVQQTALATFTKDIAELINRPVTNPVFTFENGKVKEFKAPEPGLEVKENELKALVSRSVETLIQSDTKELSIEATVSKTNPTGNISDINSFGITEQIGVGNSTYRGSIPGRIHNVALAASKINGTLLAPNETFSFNKVVGDISQKTGFQQAYVISGGKTILGDGGGVCQVSTTLFRAAMNAGLPIVERRPHSYRVGYYEQDAGPGLDATVFSPTTDFKFTNDTGHYLLIQATVDSKKTSLTFKFYGTSDGRVAEVTKPVITDQIAPPEDLYVDDPTIKVGQTKQVEHKAWGGRSTFTYTVKRNGEVVTQKKFVSVYQPWQAVYMRGTAL